MWKTVLSAYSLTDSRMTSGLTDSSSWSRWWIVRILKTFQLNDKIQSQKSGDFTPIIIIDIGSQKQI